MKKKRLHNVEWETFKDETFYNMWGVRPVDDHDFNSPRLFHFNMKEDQVIEKHRDSAEEILKRLTWRYLPGKHIQGHRRGK